MRLYFVLGIFTYLWQFKIPFVLLELLACHFSLVEKFSHICETHTNLYLSGKFICLYQATLDINTTDFEDTQLRHYPLAEITGLET